MMRDAVGWRFRLARLRALDLIDRLVGRGDPLVPPRELQGVGDSDFRRTGAEFLRIFVDVGGLRSTDDVLDVGCGSGRMARPLTTFLDPAAAYAGFDLDPDDIRWCQERYRALPNFDFRHADIHNTAYNPGGAVKASEFEFPYPADSFDFVFATSLFTHLLRPDAQRYVSEVARVLRPGGRFLSTWFLLDEQAQGVIASGRAALPFVRLEPGVASIDRERPEQGIAHDAGWVDETFRANDLQPSGCGYRGSWRGPGDALTFQDVLIARLGR